MADQNFFAAIKNAFQTAGAAPFATDLRGCSTRYDAFDLMTARAASAFYALGAKPGDRILVQVEKSIENLALYFGAMRAGLIYVPLNTAYTDEEVSYFLADADPKIFICAREREADLQRVATQNGINTVLSLDANGAGSARDAIIAATPFEEVAPCDGDDIAVILYTSGTTGRSKGAMLTHANLETNARALNTLWGFSKADKLLHALPVFHIHGLFVALHTAILSGCEVLFLAKFNLDDVMSALPRATVMMGVPTFYTRLLAEPQFDARATSHLRLFISGSAPLTAETFATFESRTGHRILERYGMSEAGMIASNPLHGDRIAGTVGFALPGVEVRVVTDDGYPANVSVSGNVEVRGPNVFKGYWRKPEKTAQEFRDGGWFATGDVGSLDNEGRLTLAGRAKDMIIAGGFNIYPKEIEMALDAAPGVAESAVIGAPHPDIGEGVVAILVANGAPAPQRVIDEAIAPLAKFKRPRRFFWIDALPRNAMGKVQKQVLRQQYKDAFD